MKITFWGVRGSIPTPGPDTVRYGGNTSCIGLDGDDGTILIFDSGTGIRLIGTKLAPLSPKEIHLFLTHTHWDHIHGFPFFVPAFIPNNVINIYGPPHFDKGLKEIMSQQMVYSYFPVNADELQAKIQYRDLKEETLIIGDITITSKLMNHPVTCFAYRVTENGKSIVYTGDNEPYYNFLVNSNGIDDNERTEIDMIVKEQNDRNVAFIKDADILIADTQYTDVEYPSKIGWGHSAISQTLLLGMRAEVKHLIFFHHDPTHTDDIMDSIYDLALREYSGSGHSGMKISIAREGMEIDL